MMYLNNINREGTLVLDGIAMPGVLLSLRVSFETKDEKFYSNPPLSRDVPTVLASIRLYENAVNGINYQLGLWRDAYYSNLIERSMKVHYVSHPLLYYACDKQIFFFEGLNIKKDACDYVDMEVKFVEAVLPSMPDIEQQEVNKVLHDQAALESHNYLDLKYYK